MKEFRFAVGYLIYAVIGYFLCILPIYFEVFATQAIVLSQIFWIAIFPLPCLAARSIHGHGEKVE